MNDTDNIFLPWTEEQSLPWKFFWGDEHFPLPKPHSDRISYIKGREAREFHRKYNGLVGPDLSSSSAGQCFLGLDDDWQAELKLDNVKSWLFKRGIPYSKIVYLIYDSVIVKTQWKILVEYCDSFAHSVGYTMIVTDLTGRWSCEFHHEDVIIFTEYTSGDT